MSQRLTFQCWRCQKTYSLLFELAGDPVLAVECPYCGQEAIADLNPYRQDQTIDVFKGDTTAPLAVGETLNLPAIIPTTPAGEG